jgi:hypothetical protein
MSLFDFGKMLGSTYESSTHKSEEHSEGRQMEVDLVVAPKMQPTELMVASGTRIIYGIIDVSNRA